MIFPSYRSPGEFDPDLSLNLVTLRPSGSSDGLGIHAYADFATKQIEKDLDPLTVRHTVVNSETVIKCAFLDPDLVTGLEF